jgi:hypothetical protein
VKEKKTIVKYVGVKDARLSDVDIFSWVLCVIVIPAGNATILFNPDDVLLSFDRITLLWGYFMFRVGSLRSTGKILFKLPAQAFLTM